MNARKVLIPSFVLILTAGVYSVQQVNSIRASGPASEVGVITLTQTGCQFLETERQDFHFDTHKAEDCQQINAATLGDRQPNFVPLRLEPGEYILRVTNQDVPYELGFYLRGEGLSQATLPSVSGGGINRGETQDYRVTFRPGNYIFSCPLNPTPDYTLVVQ